MDDCMADTAKFQDVFHRTKFVFEAVQDIELKVRPADVTTAAQVEKMRESCWNESQASYFRRPGNHKAKMTESLRGRHNFEAS